MQDVQLAQATEQVAQWQARLRAMRAQHDDAIHHGMPPPLGASAPPL